MQIDYTDKQICKRFCELTHQYLHWLVYSVCKDHAQTEEILEQYKKPTRELNEQYIGTLSLENLYVHFLGHAANKATGGNAIRAVFGSPYRDDEKWRKLGVLLDDFNPHSVASMFQTEQELRTAIIDKYPPIDFNTHIERYIISIFRLGHFFSQFDKGRHVYEYFKSYYKESPMKLFRHLKHLNLKNSRKKALYGLGDALIPDALKELGYVDFVKPDGHIKNIANLLDVVDESASDTEIAETIVGIAKRSGDFTPYHLDKFLFLIGSGDIHPELKRLDSVTRKEEFARFVKERLLLESTNKGDKVALLVNYGNDNLLRGQVGSIQSIQEKYWLVTVKFPSMTKELFPTEFVVLQGI